METQLNEQLSDFELGRHLGEGSYSTVLQCRQRKSGRLFAIKILDKRHIIKEKKVKYVHVEKEVYRLTRHCRFMVKCFYTFQDSSNLYFVLELAENGELLTWLKRLGTLNLDCTRYYLGQLLCALEFLHGLDILHRDLKPENMLLDAQMQLKLTDFGSSKIMSESTKTDVANRGSQDTSARNSHVVSTKDSDEVSAVLYRSSSRSVMDLKTELSETASPESTMDGEHQTLGGLDKSFSKKRNSFVGTAEYVSPELLTEKEATKMSDIWAVGCIAFQMQSGRPPFKSTNDYQTFQKITNLRYTFPDFVPDETKTFIQKILVLDPKERLGGGQVRGADAVHAVMKDPLLASIDFDTMRAGKSVAPELKSLVEKQVIDRLVSSEQPSPFVTPVTSPVFSTTAPVSDGVLSLEASQYSISPPNLDNQETQSSAPLQNEWNTASELKRWQKFLYPQESILLLAPVLKRKSLRIPRKRTLILTTHKRWMYIDEENWQQRGEIPFSDDISIELGKTPGRFAVITKERKYDLEDLSGNAQRWITAVERLKQSTKVTQPNANVT